MGFFLPMTDEFSETYPVYIYRRIINNNALQMFCLRLHKIDRTEIEIARNPNLCYKIFLEKCVFLYDEYFPRKRIKLKTKGKQSPRIIIERKRSSKHEQRS